MRKPALRAAFAVILTLALAGPALAHHAMGGDTPTTLLDGLVTGMAHPVIGLDHLAFTIAVGLLAAIAGAPLYAPLLFVGGTLLGCLAYLAGVTLPVTEWLILGSVLLLGFAIAAGYGRVRPVELTLFAVAGLVHGMAYAEGIVGAETSPLVAYLIGFVSVQAAIALAVLLGARAILRSGSLAPRLAGAAIAGIGFAFAFESIETLLLPVVG